MNFEDGGMQEYLQLTKVISKKRKLKTIRENHTQ